MDNTAVSHIWKFNFILLCFDFCVPLIVIGCGFGFILFHTAALDINYVPPTNTLQVVSDWSQKGYVDLKVQNEPCEGEYEPLFTKTWQGTVLGCVVEYD